MRGERESASRRFCTAGGERKLERETEKKPGSLGIGNEEERAEERVRGKGAGE